MPRNRIIYQSEAVFAGPSPATGYHLTTGAGNDLAKTTAPNGFLGTNVYDPDQRASKNPNRQLQL